MIPAWLQPAFEQAHPAWHPVLEKGLDAMQLATPDYLDTLSTDAFFPTDHRLFAAFSLPPQGVHYVLVGEGPYPRANSATGYAFMDGAVAEIWSASGLSRTVNRATSLRNFIKMLLVAEGRLVPEQTAGSALEPVATEALKYPDLWIQTMVDLQDNLLRQGFLLLNASLVYREHIAPQVEIRAWQPFLETILAALSTRESAIVSRSKPPTLILWGSLAQKLELLPELSVFAKEVSEHPYNLSFINHSRMQKLFLPMRLLKKPGSEVYL